MLVAMMLFIHDLLQAGSSSLLDVLFLVHPAFCLPIRGSLATGDD